LSCSNIIRNAIFALVLLGGNPVWAQSTVTVIGPITPGDVAQFSSTTIIKDGGFPAAGGSSGQILIGQGIGTPPIWFTLSGDATLSSSGVLTINPGAVTLAKMANGAAFSLLGNFTGSAAAPQYSTLSALTNKALPAGTDLVLIQDQAASGQLKNVQVSTLASAAGVTSIAGNTGAFTLNSASGLTNTVNDIKCQQGSSSQLGCVEVDNVTIQAAAGVISAKSTPVTNSLGADVLMNVSANYFDGPSVAQGTTGTWWASGTVSVLDTAGGALIYCKLWDGTTVIASAAVNTPGASNIEPIALSGFLSSPAANIKISCRDITATTGKIIFNTTGNSKDSTISAHRLQ
jgi:hypothetical protein